jgi:hypothetical protein
VGLIGFANNQPYEESNFPQGKEINGYRTMLNFTSSQEEFESAVATTTSAGSTYIGGALELAKQQLDRSARPHAHQVVIILLDGEPTEWKVKNNGEIKNQGYKDLLDKALTVWCAFFYRNVDFWMPLAPMPARLKRA